MNLIDIFNNTEWRLAGKLYLCIEPLILAISVRKFCFGFSLLLFITIDTFFIIFSTISLLSYTSNWMCVLVLYRVRDACLKIFRIFRMNRLKLKTFFSQIMTLKTQVYFDILKLDFTLFISIKMMQTFYN